MSSRSRLLAGLGVVSVLVLVIGGIAVAARTHHKKVFYGKRPVLTAAEIRRLSTGAKKRTIIIFKNHGAAAGAARPACSR